MSKKKNEKLEKENTEKEVILPINPTGEEITFQSVNPEANELENKDTENEQEPGANEPEVNSDSQNDTQSNENTENQEPTEEKMITLKAEVNFTDKYDNSIKYVAGKEYPFNAERAKELLNDKRGLVSEVE